MTIEQVKIKDLKNIEDVISPGVQFCPGCTMELLARVVLKLLGDDVVLFGGPSCAVFSNRGKFSYYGTLMTNIAANATGVSRAFRRQGRDTVCLAIAGDGATADIGFGGLSAAAERGEHILYICYDNEAYMNTGVQRSGTTPFGSWTNTTQIGEHSRGKSVDAKNVALLLSQHNIAYTATASMGYMQDLVNKVLKAKEAVKNGFAYIHVLAPCTEGWQYPSEKGIELSKAAVKTNYFPLWEAEYGEYRLTHIEKERKPINEYTKYMKKFAHMTEEELSTLQNLTDKKYKKIENLVNN